MPLLTPRLDSVLGQEALLLLWYSSGLRLGSRLFGSRSCGNWLLFFDFRHGGYIFEDDHEANNTGNNKDRTKSQNNKARQTGGNMYLYIVPKPS